jgi:serine kinase of HPr protein (carbohydrate metabolism regulator)
MAVKVREVFEDNRSKLELTLVTGDETLEREITRPDLERPGLACSCWGTPRAATWRR